MIQKEGNIDEGCGWFMISLAFSVALLSTAIALRILFGGW
uniref:Uncharacterized protein n=1 Tax=viral metagenome TaxID=1070528 RepID=A0A6M3JHG9_9ZZZZ